ncbi:hypothetical protein PSJ8397_00517 [Pseudooctadecabacter jejudonensis]|uniref:Uncharacterized protein n=1 Tax=Pseudooctadecabacter jejudonensis TaxID=1391910 RepID=A0A1Y5RIF6_9RHOB|nr:hypothetical protein PSJ8397_00517 [Pseudooctadecabacter jejudonensis]
MRAWDDLTIGACGGRVAPCGRLLDRAFGYVGGLHIFETAKTGLGQGGRAP